MNKSLSIDLIITDAGTQMRAGTRHETVEEYKALFVDAKWPFDDPLIVFNEGKSYWLADGFHRYYAAQQTKGRSSVACDIREGNLEDAQNFALSANSRHGLRRTNEDKRHAVRAALSMKRWEDKSNAMVAEACGVSDRFVAKIRKEIESSTPNGSELNSTATRKKPTKRVGKDGKKRSAPKPKTHQREPGDESEPDGEDPVTEVPVDDTAWKVQRSKARKTAQALTRAVDDLNELKVRRADHNRLVAISKEADAILEGWK